MSLTGRGRFFLWTDYSHETDDYSFDINVQYAVWQLEKGEKAGRDHYQGFLHLKGAQRLSLVKSRYFSNSTHLELVKKAAAAAKYCKKLKTRVRGPWTFGSPSHGSLRVNKAEAPSAYVYDPECEHNKRAKVDLLYVEKIINEGKGLDYIMLEHNILYKKYKSEISLMLEKAAKEKPAASHGGRPCTVSFFTGAPGSGKSTVVDCLSSLRGMTPYLYEGQWWASYRGERILFIDECVKGTLSFTMLNTLIDKRLNTAQVKGGHVDITNIQEVFIVSNYEFEDIFRKSDSGVVDALRRRINLFAKFELNRDSSEVTISFERYNTSTRKLMASGIITYNIAHNTPEEGRQLAEANCQENILNSEMLSDLFPRLN